VKQILKIKPSNANPDWYFSQLLTKSTKNYYRSKQNLLETTQKQTAGIINSILESNLLKIYRLKETNRQASLTEIQG